MDPLDVVRVDTQSVQLAREERGRGGAEVFLRDAQELESERVRRIPMTNESRTPMTSMSAASNVALSAAFVYVVSGTART